jgi:phosphate starvation-inducible PhoH-like protein
LEIVIQLKSPERQLELFGQADSHLRQVRDNLGVLLTARGNKLLIAGKAANVNIAAQVIDKMQKHLLRHNQLTSNDVLGYITEVTVFEGGQRAEHILPVEAEAQREEAEGATTVFSHKKVIKPNTKGQLRYVEAMLDNDLTFCIGPAGTGKTYLAVAVAVSMLRKKQIRRIVLARPAVEAGEKLGFLPGDIQAKVNPYLRPLFDALEDMMEFGQMRKLMELDIIELIPLAFMRGRTLNESVIICDEAQNTSPLQMLMVLTRLGHGSKMIITGDVTQIDLPAGQKSGMIDAIDRLRRIRGIGVVELARGDIVRHRLVQNIVRAYQDKRTTATKRVRITDDLS